MMTNNLHDNDLPNKALRARRSLQEHLGALMRACSYNGSPHELLNSHKCDECDLHADRYIAQVFNQMHGGREPIEMTRCPMTLVRCCAALCCLLRHSGLVDEESRALIDGFDAQLPGAIDLEHEFIVQDGLLARPSRRRPLPRPRRPLAAGLVAFFALTVVLAATLGGREPPPEPSSIGELDWPPYLLFPNAKPPEAPPPPTEPDIIESCQAKRQRPVAEQGCSVRRQLDWSERIDAHVFVVVTTQCLSEGLAEIDVKCSGADCGGLTPISSAEARHEHPGIYPANARTLGLSLGQLRPSWIEVHMSATCCRRE
jgi:hypothetical protein